MISSFPCIQVRHMSLLICKGIPPTPPPSHPHPVPWQPVSFPVLPLPHILLLSESTDTPPSPQSGTDHHLGEQSLDLDPSPPSFWSSGILYPKALSF